MMNLSSVKSVSSNSWSVSLYSFHLCIDKIKQMYSNADDAEIVLVEGNIWEAFKRIKHRAIEQRKNEPATSHKKKNDSESDEDSWIASDEEQDIVHWLSDDFKSKLSVGNPKIYLRSTTYQQRKQTALHKLHKDEENSVAFTSRFSSDSEDSPNERRSMFTNVEISVKNLNDETTKAAPKESKEEIKEKETKTIDLVNKICVGSGINITKHLIKSISKDGLVKMNAENKEILKIGSKPIELDDVVIEFDTREVKPESRKDIMSNIVTEYFKNRISTLKKKTRSGVVQFLIDNNLRQETIGEEHFDDHNDENDLVSHQASVGSFSKMINSQNDNREMIKFGDDSPLKRKKVNKNKPIARQQNDSDIIPLNKCEKWSYDSCYNGSICGWRDTVTENGMLITMFAWLMIHFNHIIDATRAIEEFGFKFKNDKMCIANMHKLFGMIYLMEDARNEAISHLNKAIDIFKKLSSVQGQASWYYLKSIAIRIPDLENEYNNVNSEIESKKTAERAMYFYKLLKHREGFNIWSKLCRSSQNPPNKIPKISYNNDPFYVPYIEIESGFEFLSLGIEPVLTTKFEEKIDRKLTNEVTRRKSTLNFTKEFERVSTNEAGNVEKQSKNQAFVYRRQDTVNSNHIQKTTGINQTKDEGSNNKKVNSKKKCSKKDTYKPNTQNSLNIHK